MRWYREYTEAIMIVGIACSPEKGVKQLWRKLKILLAMRTSRR